MISIPDHLAARSYSIVSSVDFPIPQALTLDAIAHLEIYRLKNSRAPDSEVFSSQAIRGYEHLLRAEELETIEEIEDYLTSTEEKVRQYKQRLQVLLDRQEIERNHYYAQFDREEQMQAELKLQNCSYQGSFL